MVGGGGGWGGGGGGVGGGGGGGGDLIQHLKIKNPPPPPPPPPHFYIFFFFDGMFIRDVFGGRCGHLRHSCRYARIWRCPPSWPSFNHKTRDTAPTGTAALVQLNKQPRGDEYAT